MEKNWRITKDSIQWKFLEGFSSSIFLNWLAKTAQDLDISKDELLLGIAESVKYIECATLEVLREKTGQIVCPPPFIIVTYPDEIAAVEMAILADPRPEFFTNREEVQKNFVFAYIHIHLGEIHQTLAEIFGGNVISGAANKFLTGLYDRWLIGSLEKYIATRDTSQLMDFLQTIIEETFHYFSYQTNTFGIKEMTEEFVRKAADIQNLDELYKVKDEIEKAFGVKEVVSEIAEKLKDKTDDFFAPLWTRIKQKPTF